MWIYLPKLIKVNWNLTKFLQKQKYSFLRHRICLSCTVSEIFNVEWGRVLEIWIRLIHVIENGTIRTWLIATWAIISTVSRILRRKLQKSPFYIPQSHLKASVGLIPWELSYELTCRYERTRIHGTPHGENRVFLRLVLSTLYRPGLSFRCWQWVCRHSLLHSKLR